MYIFGHTGNGGYGLWLNEQANIIFGKINDSNKASIFQDFTQAQLGNNHICITSDGTQSIMY
jgi:hypothetical protein